MPFALLGFFAGAAFACSLAGRCFGPLLTAAPPILCCGPAFVITYTACRKRSQPSGRSSVSSPFFLEFSPTMPNPWDRPPRAAIGDINADDTYAGVGHVLSQWEQVEIQLGYLHSAFLFKHLDWYAMIEYGKGHTFRARSGLLLAEGTRFFVKTPNQQAEAEFEALYQKIVAFSDRRHDVAHGIVRDETWANWRTPGFQDPNSMGRRYFLLPSHYKAKNLNEHLLPEYAYWAPTLRSIAHDLMMLALEIQGFSTKIAKL
jgi:hypothetical protein